MARHSHAASDPYFHYTAKAGDTLIELGQSLLTRPSDWPQLAKINRIANPRRIPVGTTLRIPVELLKSTPVPGQVVAIVGSSTVSLPGGASQSLQLGSTVPPGSEIRTQVQAYVTLKLADGSLLRMQPSTVATLDQSRHYTSGGFFASRIKLLRGRIEALVAHLTGGEPRFEIQTPKAVMGVRGTEFRTVVADASPPDTGAAPVEAATYGEVLDGAVAVETPAAATRTPTPPVLQAGWGVRVGAGGAPEVTQLLPAPDLSAVPTLHERLLVRIPLKAEPGAASYRGQVASDAEMQHVLGEVTSTTPELRFANLPDGTYHLRVRGIDAKGLEGLNAQTGFKLKARPEPPTPTQPAAKAKIRAESTALAWAEQAEAAHYRLQVASTAEGFAKPVLTQDEIKAAKLDLPLPPGDYLWRLASVKADGDQGPWGDALEFAVRPLPAQPAPPRIDDKTLHFSWAGEAGQRFELQLARDPSFAKAPLELKLDTPEAHIDKPIEGGKLYMRYRAIDADGYVGPYTSPQLIELPACAQDRNGHCLSTGSSGILQSR